MDGRLATEINTVGPWGVALDAAGNIYFSEEGGNFVRRIDVESGRIETLAGNGAGGYGGDGRLAKFATLNHPAGLFVDRNSGDVYIADADNGRVRRIDWKTGMISTVAGRGSDRSDGTLGDGGSATDAVLVGPTAVWLDRGTLYITETQNCGHRLRKVVNGTISTVAGATKTFEGAIDCTGGYSADPGPASEAKLNNPITVIVDSDGNIFIADKNNHRVRRIDAQTLKIDTYAGTGDDANDGDGRPATEAKLAEPSGLALDAGGNLLIQSGLTGQVRRVEKNAPHLISTYCAPRSYGGYTAIAANARGDIFSPARSGGAVIKYSAGSPIDSYEFVAGCCSPFFVGDRLVATAAVLQSPRGLAIDAEGNLFIADLDRLRRVDRRNIMTTVAGTGNCCPVAERDGKPATSVSV